MGNEPPRSGRDRSARGAALSATAFLAAIVIGGCPALAQSDRDLPCNALCLAWLGLQLDGEVQRSPVVDPDPAGLKGVGDQAQPQEGTPRPRRARSRSVFRLAIHRPRVHLLGPTRHAAAPRAAQRKAPQTAAAQSLSAIDIQMMRTRVMAPKAPDAILPPP